MVGSAGAVVSEKAGGIEHHILATYLPVAHFRSAHLALATVGRILFKI